MKVLFALLIAAASLLGISQAADPCNCYANQTVSSTVAAVTIGPPTVSGGFGTAQCGPVICNTVVTFTGNLSNGLPAGASISFVQCSSVAANNYVTLYGGDQVDQTFTGCPPYNYSISDLSHNVFTFAFNLTAPINFTVVLKPKLQVPPTTTPPPATTTPVYSGIFPFNPAIARMDLVVGLDAGAANQQWFGQIHDVVMNMLQYFTISSDFVRLSYMSFDSYSAVGSGQVPLWNHTLSTMNATFNNVAPFPGTQSKYFSTLETYLFDRLEDFPLRDNTERVFIIFTGTDGFFEQTKIDTTKNNINKYDIKFIFVNMNTSLTTQGVSQTALQAVYPTLSVLSGTNSNQAHWFDYKLNQNNAENLLNTFYFDGNALCNVPTNANVPVSSSTDEKPYTLPTSNSPPALIPTAFYCNYMNDVRTYLNTNSNPQSVLRIHLLSYDLNTGNDYIRVGIDGVEVGVLTGRFGAAYYCLQGSKATVTFQSKNGLIYNGYNSTVSGYPTYGDCYASLSRSGSKFMDVSKRQIKPIFKL